MVHLHWGNKWIDVVPFIEAAYNETPHSRTLVAPNNVTKYNEQEIINRLYPPTKNERPKFKIGDRCRLLKYKSIFDKGTKATFTDEIFEIYKINIGSPTVYYLKDDSNEPLLGLVYGNELSLVTRSQPKLTILKYKIRNHKRYVQFTENGGKPKWEAVTKFNQRPKTSVVV